MSNCERKKSFSLDEETRITGLNICYKNKTIIRKKYQIEREKVEEQFIYNSNTFNMHI